MRIIASDKHIIGNSIIVIEEVKNIQVEEINKYNYNRIERYNRIKRNFSCFDH
jgi:hypothetical protein